MATRLASHEFTWPSGDRVRRSAITTEGELPDEVVQAVRCLVVTDGGLVVCTNKEGGVHAWPGGQRETAESISDTATREVHEETGWLLDVDSIEQVGWIHFEHLSPVAPDHPWPNPDSFSAVVFGRASRRQADEWTDTEGYEVHSQVVQIRDAAGLVTDQLCHSFLSLVEDRLRGGE